MLKDHGSMGHSSELGKETYTKFRTMMHNDLVNPTGLNEMLFAGQTRVSHRTIILVAGAH